MEEYPKSQGKVARLWNWIRTGRRSWTVSVASHGAGTMQFMAIEVLQRNRYTYRHRLESFSRPYLDVHSSNSPWMTRSWVRS
ncbi:hypothetical protein DL95DRAFT_397666, partial [Leptodontidium sp. 2 PMI_412]